jgi:hypothetical protein
MRAETPSRRAFTLPCANVESMAAPLLGRLAWLKFSVGNLDVTSLPPGHLVAVHAARYNCLDSGAGLTIGVQLLTPPGVLR